ncbi:MAG: ABC transporter [Pirellulaceae bacterium]|nr:MAG: ABC transporter [Pirellulaceae bacterium]
MAPTDVAVETERLTKCYGQLTALHEVSLRVGRGQILGIIGPNGAGKTTLIKILVGLARPTSGRAWIGGVDCVRYARRIKRLVGYMPDTFGAYDNMRVSEYLDFFGAVFGVAPRQRRQRIQAVLEMVDGLDLWDRYVETLSHGMQQKVAIARTLMHDPQVLILDEPANGLDPEARVEMRQLLLNLARGGKTLIVTSHILPELSRICDLVAILSSGRLKAFGPLADIMRRVRQERTIEIQLVRPDDVPRTVARVNQWAGDELATASVQELVVRFRTAHSEEWLADLLKELVEQGIRVGQLRELQADLEDAFLEVTREPDRSAADAVRSASGAAAGSMEES